MSKYADGLVEEQMCFRIVERFTKKMPFWHHVLYPTNGEC